MTEPEVPYTPEPRKALVVWWDPVTNHVAYDGTGLSCFDVVGLLQTALELAECELPTPFLSEEEIEPE